MIDLKLRTRGTLANVMTKFGNGFDRTIRGPVGVALTGFQGHFSKSFELPDFGHETRN